ncbi:CPBP family intramembrane metalloprotease [bacterium]|nr:CPBP family intramembrane metalloprotease [bacterium]
MSKLWKIIELIFLFIALPVLMKFNIIPLPRLLSLMIVFGFVLFISIRLKYLDRNWYKLPTLDSKYWLKMGLTYLASFLFFIAYIYFFLGEKPFILLRERPHLMIIISIFYPLFSAFPQEVIYRSFFFERYKNIFTTKYLLISNMLAFSFLHIIYNNLPALILTLISSLVFTLNYQKKRSLMLVTIEHSILGLIVFITGMGRYFYK